MTSRLRLIGGTMSPYSRKMVALLRYRHIPYQVIWGDINQKLPEMGIEKPKPVLYPVFLMPDKNGQEVATVDSTPIIRTLESQYTGRSVLPDHPVMDFINSLLEDFGDEWCVKYMFHYRWNFKEDIRVSGPKLIYSSVNTLPKEPAKQMADMFSQRQISRLFWVGSNETTAPLIEASYERFLILMDKHLEAQPFLLGSRPSSADFAVHGQLTQLIAEDPTPRRIAHDVSLRTVSWTDIMEDQSGLDEKSARWNAPSNLPETLMDILREVGRTYVPTMIANAKAVIAGEESWTCHVDGHTWEQPVNLYQAKCLKWIREEFKTLSTDHQHQALEILSEAGCKPLIDASIEKK
ncbi:glutathione S-transferase N-terminal domain-containing protein [Temperatibacter marinus]|uniref:Glutathione S-transferase N-terminal domain-containing protein n=1 Tax=Temperatibacter marinus TaxID=1456591 RepID=A0AA52EI69_9PROT|nr:glutathione S-transferase N-terminal domain-containing protein [Temperatibacter marinus]WND02997.1 glutathione S-transferase N-terminal domain-containing protein [Temperatibacter marinus]